MNEFILIPISLVIGISLTEIFKSLAAIFKHSNKITGKSSLFIIISILTIVQIQYWWQISKWTFDDKFTIFNLILAMIIPCLIYLIAEIAIPSNDDIYCNDTKKIDMFKNIYNRRKLLCGFAIIIPITYFMIDIFITDSDGIDPVRSIFRIVFIVQLFVNIVSSNKRVIKYNIFLLGVLFIVFIIIKDVFLKV